MHDGDAPVLVGRRLHFTPRAGPDRSVWRCVSLPAEGMNPQEGHFAMLLIGFPLRTPSCLVSRFKSRSPFLGAAELPALSLYDP